MRLSAFQKRILKHALNFPSVQRVVYSTCSKYKEVWHCAPITYVGYFILLHCNNRDDGVRQLVANI